MTILERVNEVQPFVRECRHILHRWPELAMEEFKTTNFICEKLDEMGIPYRRTEPTGCIAEIKGAHPGKTVALRADIDALNIHEINDLPFKSEREGYMHGCGHDTHTAMLLGAAKILNEIKGELKGTVRLLFQPAEEPGHGAKAMVAQGAMEGVDACFGEHIYGILPTGTVTTTAGTMVPSVGVFKIKVHGVSCHGAMPHLGVDATVCGCAMVMNLQTIASREINPLTPIVVTVGSFHSGSRYNVCSGEVEMEGTVRLFDEKLHQEIPGIMQRIIDETAKAFRCTAELEYEFGSHALITDEKITDIVKKAALKILPSPEMLIKWPGAMGGEDFSEYTRYVPCAFVGIGVGGTVSVHNERFLVDESAFVTGVALHVQFALDFLNS